MALINISLQKELFAHAWKKFSRSSSFRGRLFDILLIHFFSLLTIIYFLSVGYFLDSILVSTFQNRKPSGLVNSYLFFSFLVMIIIHFFMSRALSFNSSSYLNLPISKNAIVNHFLIRTVFSLSNLLSLCILIPFWGRTIVKEATIHGSLLWLITVFALFNTAPILGLLLKLLLKNWLRILISFFFIVVCILGGLFFDGHLLLEKLSGSFFDSILSGNMLLVLLTIILFYICHLFLFIKLKLYLYLDA